MAERNCGNCFFRNPCVIKPRNLDTCFRKVNKKLRLQPPISLDEFKVKVGVPSADKTQDEDTIHALPNLEQLVSGRGNVPEGVHDITAAHNLDGTLAGFDVIMKDGTRGFVDAEV